MTVAKRIKDYMTSRICCIGAILFLTGAAHAQEVVDSVLSDLNTDGLRERFTLLHDGTGLVDLIIEDTGTGRVTATDIAWIGAVGQEPELDLALNGSVRLTSMNEAVGRNRWHLTLTLAHRDGTYKVAGFTYDWYDTLDPKENGSCDLNLLNGKGITQKGYGPKVAIRHEVAALPVTRWKEDHPFPDVCRLWE